MKKNQGLMYRIFHSRTEAKIQIDNLDVWVRFVIRPFSFLVTYPFMKLGFSADAVSIVSMFVSLAGLLMVAILGNNGILAALIIFNFWIVLDAVDGNVARTSQTFSKKGTYIDAISGYLYLVVLYVTLGLAVYDQTESIVWLCVGFTTSLMTVFPRLVLQKKIAMFGNLDKDVSQKTRYGWKEKLALNVAGPAGLMNPLMIIAYLLNLLWLYLLAYAIVQCGLGLVTIASVFKAVNDEN